MNTTTAQHYASGIASGNHPLNDTLLNGSALACIIMHVKHTNGAGHVTLQTVDAFGDYWPYPGGLASGICKCLDHPTERYAVSTLTDANKSVWFNVRLPL